MRILDDAQNKLRAWYQYYPDASDPNSPYRMALKARGGATSNVDRDGKVSGETLDVIESVLRGSFNMGRQMCDKAEFEQRLALKLRKEDVRMALSVLRSASISAGNLAAFQNQVWTLYNELCAQGPGGLSAREDAFCVGATKIMHFLFPEFLVMLDKWAANGIGYKKYNNLEAYWAVLKLCKAELGEWRVRYGTLDTLQELDVPPTTPTRVFDKCAFVMGHPDLRRVYEVWDCNKVV